jgi:protein-S-isoprenylcysteine O-methyltransferase Ste14
LFLLTFVYAVGFIGGFLTPTQLDGPRQGSLATSLAIDAGLLSLFAVQHSGMARPRFKRWLTRFVPGPAERSTYVLLSSVVLLLLFWQWRPLGGLVWDISDGLLRVSVYALFAAGWATVFVATCLISHFDLFGVCQVWLAFRGVSYHLPPFATPWAYRVVRHPLYVGWLMAFWAAPTMAAAHLLFAFGMTTYILLAIRWEERDLVAVHPEYSAYRRRVPMLLPRLRLRPSSIPRTPDSPLVATVDSVGADASTCA